MGSSIFITMPKLRSDGLYHPSPIKCRLRLDPSMSEEQALSVNYSFIRFMHASYCNSTHPDVTSMDRAQLPFKAMIEICEPSQTEVLSLYKLHPDQTVLPRKLNRIQVEIVKVSNYFPMVAVNCTTNGFDPLNPRHWMVPNKGFMVQVTGSLERDSLANKWITQVCKLLLLSSLYTGRYDTPAAEASKPRKAYKCRIVDSSGRLIQTVDLPLPTQSELLTYCVAGMPMPTLAPRSSTSPGRRVTESIDDPTHFIEPALTMSSEVRAVVLSHSESYRHSTSVRDDPDSLESASTATRAPTRVSEDTLVQSLAAFYVPAGGDSEVRSPTLYRQEAVGTIGEATPAIRAARTVRFELARDPEPPRPAGLCARLWNYVCCRHADAENPGAHA